MPAAVAPPTPTGSGQAAAVAARPWLGYLAMLVTLAIWTGFVLSIRAIGKSPLAPADVALLRFGLPALVLLPLLPGRWQQIRAVRLRHVAMILAGGGLPFFFAASAGGAATSAAHVGALVPGTAPLFVAALGALLYRQTVAGSRRLGLALIALGVLALLATSLTALRGPALAGSALLLCASCLWGLYTHGLRRAGVDAIGCNLLLCLPSLGAVAALVATGALPTQLGHFGWSQALPFILLQGLGAGVVAGFTYAFAIRRIGAERSAVIGSLTPALASLVALPVLGEPLDATTVAGIALITGGVVFANLDFSSTSSKGR